MKMATWIASKDIEVETGTLIPRSYVGSAWLVKGKEVFVITWRGEDEWESKWNMLDSSIAFDFIKRPDGTILAWGSQNSMRPYIPTRHVQIIDKICELYGKYLYNEELNYL